jgi:hypothetical protein
VISTGNAEGFERPLKWYSKSYCVASVTNEYFVTPPVKCIGQTKIFGPCPSMSARENESMLRTYVVVSK